MRVSNRSVILAHSVAHRPQVRDDETLSRLELNVFVSLRACVYMLTLISKKTKNLGQAAL